MRNSFRVIIKVFIFLTFLIIILSLFSSHYFEGDECASRKEDRPERDSVTTIEKPVAKIMCENIEHKDYVFNKIEEIVQNNLTQETYSYNQWEHKTTELIGVETCEHSSDFEYQNHKCNILDYLNWHLIKKISHYGNEDLINGINNSILMTDSLILVQYDLMENLFENEDLRYDFYGLALEFKSLINDELIAIQSVLSDGTFKPKKITQINEYTYECPSIRDDIITKEYQRFITEYIPKSDGKVRSASQVSDLIDLLSIERTMWEIFIKGRKHTEILLSGKNKDVWGYNTKVWKLNKIKQLKNEFECYGTMSGLDYSLSLGDCNYSELMNFHSLSKAREDYNGKGK